MSQAACTTSDPELFHPDTPQQTEMALRVCRGCPVIEHCAEYGRDENHGIYGGLTPRMRGVAKGYREDRGIKTWLRRTR